MYLNSSDLEIGRDARANQMIGLHYQNVNLPPNVTIIDAKLVFTIDEPQSQPASGTFFGEVAGNTQPFSNTVNNISNRERMTTSVTWSDIPTWGDADVGSRVESPSLLPIIQELVDDSAWTAGSSLAIIVEGEGRRAVASYNEGGENAPILQIAYVTTEQTNEQINDQTNSQTVDQTNGRTSVKLKLSSSTDAVEERADGTMYLNSSDLEIGQDAGESQLIGLRYQNVNIPPNVMITDAKLIFTIDEAQSEAAAGTFFGEAISNTEPFSDTVNNISNRERTMRSVTWNDIPTWDEDEVGNSVESPSLLPIIQEIVDDSAWTAGNSLAIIVEGEGRRSVASYNGDGENAPILQIEYATTDQTDDQTNIQININVPLSIHLQSTTFTQSHTHVFLLALLSLVLFTITTPLWTRFGRQ